jgi:hypothetical protein
MIPMKLTVLTANVSGAISKDTLNGKEYIVAPVTMIVPGVLNGSQGALLYPIETLRQNPSRWNGMPIVVHHPKVDGEHVSARSPNILNIQGVGQIFEARVNGKLTAEAWFDIEATRRVDNTILEALEKGQPFELSTGLFTTHTEEEGTFNSVHYEGIVRAFEPDHLAVFTDTKGACSVKDGCGVLVNKPKEKDMDKVKLIDYLIKEEQVWNEDDRDVLDKLEDKKLEALVNESKARKEQSVKDEEKQEQLEAVANAAREGYKDCQGNQHAYNEEKGEWETTLNTVTTVVKKEEPVVNTEEPKEPQTNEEWFNTAPPEIQIAVRNSMAIVDSEKAILIDRLVANIEDDEKKAKLIERFKTKELDELRDLAMLNPAANNENPFTSSYVGAAVPAFNKEEPKIQKPEPLGLPVWEF